MPSSVLAVGCLLPNRLDGRIKAHGLTACLGAQVSGTLYVSLPPDAGRLHLKDPRRAHGEILGADPEMQAFGSSPDDSGSFEAEAVLEVTSGLIALFPPWVEHYVAHTPGAVAP